jgi:hypothetical protein
MAIERHAEFVRNALEDIALKREKHEKALREELTASTVMVNNARRLIGECVLCIDLCVI